MQEAAEFGSQTLAPLQSNPSSSPTRKRDIQLHGGVVDAWRNRHSEDLVSASTLESQDASGVCVELRLSPDLCQLCTRRMVAELLAGIRARVVLKMTGPMLGTWDH